MLFRSVLIQAAEDMGVVGEMLAKNAADGAIRFASWVGDQAAIAPHMQAVLSPKLIRRLCTNCREAYRPNPKLLAKVGLPPETTALYRQPKDRDEETGQQVPVHCNVCGGLGYYGRTVMMEVLEFTDKIKEAFAAGADAATLKALAREENMTTHRTEGIRLVAEGITSLEELQRTFAG